MSAFGKYWGVILMALPFYIGFGTNVYIGQVQFFAFIGACLFSLIFFEKKKINLDLFTIVAILYFCSMAFFNQWNPYSGNVILQYLSICLASAVFIQMRNNFNKEDASMLLGLIGISTIIQSLWIIGNKLGFDPYHFIMELRGYTVFKKTELGDMYLRKSVEIAGSLNHPTHSGAMIAAGSIALLRGRLKYLLPLVMYSLYLTGSSMSFVSLIFGYTLILTDKFKSLKKYIIATPFIGITSYYFIGSLNGFFSDTKRFYVWEKLLNWPEGMNFWLGFGPGYLPDKFKTTFNIMPPFLKAHNEFIEVFLMFGVIGVLMSLAFIHKLALRNKYIYFTAILFTLVVNSLGNFTFHIGPLSAMGLVCLAFMYKGIKENKDGVFIN